jgi:hypothetical protein
MRKITQQAVDNFLSCKPFQLSNTVVRLEGEETQLVLFDNVIATINVKGELKVSLGGHHFTKTTQERLNGLPGVCVRRKAGRTLLNDQPWDGKFIEIK